MRRMPNLRPQVMQTDTVAGWCLRLATLLATTVVSTGVVTHLARVTIEILREPRSYLISRMLILSPLASEIIILIIES
jgi:hypothetical protein